MQITQMEAPVVMIMYKINRIALEQTIESIVTDLMSHSGDYIDIERQGCCGINFNSINKITNRTCCRKPRKARARSCPQGRYRGSASSEPTQCMQAIEQESSPAS